MADAPQVEERRGREGGRWINERPSSEDFAAWFAQNMKIDDKLDSDSYIGGVVLIPAEDTKAKYVKEFRNGHPVIEQRPELSFIPYAKVETRTNYFWDLLGVHEEWVGVVERISSPRLPLLTPLEEVVEVVIEAEGGPERTITKRKQQQAGGIASMVHQLPEGFSLMSVPVGDGYSHFVLCTIRVAIYNREEYKEDPAKAVPLRAGQGTKQVPLSKSYNQRSWADDSSLMKAETGALGRALGVAGIFVIPGSGVATAEDMLESMAQGATPAEPPPAEGNQGPAAPDQPIRTGEEQREDDETELRRRGAAAWKALSEDFPERAQEVGQSLKQRKPPVNSLNDVKGAALRGVVRKLETTLDEAKQRQGADDVPTEAAVDAGADGSDDPAHEGDAGDAQSG